MSLNNSQKKYLRRLDHDLKVVVMVGQAGLTETVFAEIDQALRDHELVKVKLRLGDRAMKAAATQAICARLGCECTRSIGNIGVFYRRNPDKAKIALP